MPLRYLFVDMNAYFASVEQLDEPRLRGRPVAVVPVLAETTSCIAASYEAKRWGVKTGTPVWEARRLCRGLVVRQARPERYVAVHHDLVRAVGRCVPVTKVMSVDEMACGLLGAEREADNARLIALNIKAEIRKAFGFLTCSIGVGPNVVLAKVAGDMIKPDGLTLIQPHELPGKLYALKLTDLPGIGPRMEVRFHRAGVTTTRQLVGLTVPALARIWGSLVHAERWYYLLRGEDVVDPPTRRRTVGHSHVLAPELRTDAGAYAVLMKLVYKAAARLRTMRYWTGKLWVGVRYADGTYWGAKCHLPRCQDTLGLLRAFGVLWGRRPAAGRPTKVGMALWDLVPAAAATPSLFEEERKSAAVSHAMDRINRALGKQSVRFGGLCGLEAAAPTRVAFNRIPDFHPASE